MLENISIPNKCCSFEVYQRIMGKCIRVSIKTLSSTLVFNIDNDKKCFINHQISISE